MKGCAHFLLAICSVLITTAMIDLRWWLFESLYSSFIYLKPIPSCIVLLSFRGSDKVIALFEFPNFAFGYV